MDSQEVMLCQECASFGTDMMWLYIILHVEETRNNKLFIVDALDRTDTLHAKVAIEL